MSLFAQNKICRAAATALLLLRRPVHVFPADQGVKRLRLATDDAPAHYLRDLSERRHKRGKPGQRGAEFHGSVRMSGLSVAIPDSDSPG